MLRTANRSNLLAKIATIQCVNGLSTTSSVLVKEECPVKPTNNVDTCPQSTIEADELLKARPTSEIPGPKSLPFIGIMHKFLPGGEYFNVKMPELHRRMRTEHGNLVMLPGSMGRPDMVLTYDPEDFAKLYRNEGQWPHRRAFAVFEYFRKHERPDLFKGRAGLLSE